MRSDWFIENLKDFADNSAFSFFEPHRTISREADQDIVLFEFWHRNKKLAIYFEPDGIYCLKIWGSDINNQMDELYIESVEDIKKVWRWLNR